MDEYHSVLNSTIDTVQRERFIAQPLEFEEEQKWQTSKSEQRMVSQDLAG